MSATRSLGRAAVALLWGSALALTSTVSASADDAAKPAPPAKSAPASGPVYREFIQGSKKAKVTVIEYASLTCPHCAHFDMDNYPTLKKDYIDSGKIQFIFRDFPLDGLAMAAAVLARCVPGDRGMTLIDLFFKNQNVWAATQTPIEPMKMYAQMVGMSGEDVDACFQNKPILEEVEKVAEAAGTLYHVNSTPTFLIGDDQVAGANYDALKEAIDKALAKNTK